MKQAQTTTNAAGPMPAALLIEQMPGATLAARLDTIEDAISRIEQTLLTTHAPTTPPDYLSRKEAAALLRVSLPTLQDWTNKQILKAYKVGRRVYYKPEEIAAAMVKRG